MDGAIRTETIEITPAILKLIAEEALLAGLEVKAFASRNEEEVAGYAETIEAVFSHYEEIALTENHIKQLHRDLLHYSSKDERDRGGYKTHNNHVEAIGPNGESLGVVFETASPFDTPRLILGNLPELSVQILELCRERGTRYSMSV